ncbi:MAG TPA: GyrI-like domain-containing protein [Thermomicrobiales bacterium]|nr:GyrI-like domain-containing protein [Thermomicrobiales bacterium]
MLEIQVRTVAAQRVVTEKKTVDQAQLMEWLPGAMGRTYEAAEAAGGWTPSNELAWLGRENLKAEPVFIVIYEGNPNEGPTEIEVCTLVAADIPDGDGVRTIPAHQEAFAHLTRTEADPSVLGAAYEELASWILGGGKQMAGAPREIYYTDYFGAAPDDIVCDLAWPVTGS